MTRKQGNLLFCVPEIKIMEFWQSQPKGKENSCMMQRFWEMKLIL